MPATIASLAGSEQDGKQEQDELLDEEEDWQPPTSMREALEQCGRYPLAKFTKFDSGLLIEFAEDDWLRESDPITCSTLRPISLQFIIGRFYTLHPSLKVRSVDFELFCLTPIGRGLVLRRF